ncbi:MAG: spermidine/putrescine transport system ATP-binding protein [Verrucomicrobiota bacterium]|jgi:spermidine/putrescine transport system ATP-binding protein
MLEPVVSTQPAVEVVNVSRRFGLCAALTDLHLKIGAGEFLSILGPSGCGKTTLLRIIAGLDLPDAGSIHLFGRDVTRVPAHQRPVNTVFQSYALFPHLTVRDNIAFGLRMKKVAAEESKRRVAAVMETTQIAELADRKPSGLSGGQSQRVALARALVNEPKVLLLDEPLGALDLKLRRQLQGELHSLQRRLGITFVFVTHDQEEALALSDRIAVMNEGRIEQLGGAQELYEHPRNRFVARFLGACNLLPGIVRGIDGASLIISTSLCEIKALPAQGVRAFTIGNACTLAVRPEKMILRDAADGPRSGELEARILGAIYNGAATTFELDINGTQIHVTSMSGVASENRKPGRRLFVLPPGPENSIVLED